MSGVLVVPRYLSVLQQDGDILVGLMPPRAVTNLTRQTLFDESSVGRPKVEVAAARLRALNADVVLRPVCSTFYGAEVLDEHFANCNMVILSGFVYSNAGYIKTFGVVGPLVVPGRSACYACMRASADLQTATGGTPQNLNSRHQAATGRSMRSSPQCRRTK